MKKYQRNDEQNSVYHFVTLTALFDILSLFLLYCCFVYHCYKVITKNPVLYADAQRMCAADSAHLVYITSEEERKELISLVDSVIPGNAATRKMLWTGGCRTGPNTEQYAGPFVWTTECSDSGPTSSSVQTPMSYAVWSIQQPDDSQVYSTTGLGEHCVLVFSGTDLPGGELSLNDIPCDYGYIEGAICEYDHAEQAPQSNNQVEPSSPSACPDGFVQLESHCYKVLNHGRGILRSDAQSQCASLNEHAHLVYIESKQEEQQLIQLLHTSDAIILDVDQVGHIHVWTGGCRVKLGSDDFVWSSTCKQHAGPSGSDVTPWNYKHWAPNQPDYAGDDGEWCTNAYFGTTSVGLTLTWNDVSCTSVFIHASVCEVDAV